SEAILTPNGRPEPVGSRLSRVPRILVVGRIETRKRSLDVARVSRDMNVPITFVGGVNQNEPSYIEDFRSIVDQTPILTWTGEVDHARVLELMSSSTVLLNCSWVEVQSLVDLEAAFRGCRVITVANGGSSKEWLGENVIEYP